MTKHDIESMAANGQIDRATVGPALAHLARLEELGTAKRHIERQIEEALTRLDRLLENTAP